jgi:hypothetical protein
MKAQEGYLTQESGKWLGHFSRWVINYKTGEKKRQHDLTDLLYQVEC